MEITEWIEKYGAGPVLAVGGALIGILFGFMAQRSKFCLRAAVIEFWHGKFGEKLTVWLLTFSTAVIAIQALIIGGALDVSGSRQMVNRGSLSGALLGGILFGGGMIMTRGCASRLLVLSANGNLRALLSGLIFAVAAQSALSGALSPLRQEVASWWTVEGGSSRDVLALAAAVPRVRFVAKREVKYIPLVGAAAGAAGHVYIDRSNRKAAFEQYEAAAARIHAGAHVIVFAEGTRGHEYALRPFKKGPFVLAIQLLAMTGTAFILSAVGVFFRDIRDIVQISGMLLIFLMPIVYLPTAIPAAFSPARVQRRGCPCAARYPQTSARPATSRKAATGKARPTMVMASTSRPITGISRVLNSISPAMKVSATPATAPSMAARGR